MPGSMERSSLHVEGRDDKFALVNLLIRHGVDYDPKPWPAAFPEFKEVGNIQGLLDGMETAVKLSTGRAVGFVLDADSPLLDRWHAVRDRLRNAGVDAPKMPIAEGFIGHSSTFWSTVGVWLMPDNQHDGKLETFLETLIGDEDPLIDHATASTDAAKQLGALFTEPDHIKALIHTWLAWQNEPGYPYGTAIRARCFRHDSPAAAGFVAWFRQLYGIS
ncbi:MAG: DUF3226 domain-containing protein [Planctomycetota bacterium]